MLILTMRCRDPFKDAYAELPVDVALGKVDYIEVVGFAEHQVDGRDLVPPAQLRISLADRRQAPMPWPTLPPCADRWD